MRILNLRTLGLSTFVVALASAGCSEAVPRELADARQAYARAQTGPASDYNPAQLRNAERSLKLAEATFDDEGDTSKTRDRAYVAMRKSQTAEVQARTLASQQEEAKYQKQAAELERARYERTRAELDAERAKRAQAEQHAESAAAELARFAAVKQDQRGMVVTLSGEVLFRSGKSELMPAARNKLSQVVHPLKADPSASITIEGHTDSKGSERLNERLSQERADSVRDYLVSQGLNGNQVQAVGKGESEPIADNTSAEGRANNRRVEIIIKNPDQQAGAAPGTSPPTMQGMPAAPNTPPQPGTAHMRP